MIKADVRINKHEFQKAEFLAVLPLCEPQRLGLGHMSDWQCVYIAMPAIILKYAHDEKRKRITGTGIFTPPNSVPLLKGQRLSLEHMSDF